MMNLQVIEQNNERVLTTQQLADIYECEPRRITENFNPRPKQMTSADAMKMVLANPRTYAKMLMEFADVQEQNAKLMSENIMLSDANEGLEQKNMALESSIARKDKEWLHATDGGTL